MIPRIGATGLYELRTPFTANPSETFTCIALRKFSDLLELKEDPSALFYFPFGLTIEDYERDLRDNVVIVTLKSDKNTIIYVPSSYILRIPKQDLIKYRRLVLSIDLGVLPDDEDLSVLIDEMRLAAVNTLGINTPEVYLSESPTTGLITASEHQAALVARNANKTITDTLEKRYNRLVRQNEELTEQVRLLEEFIENQ